MYINTYILEFAGVVAKQEIGFGSVRCEAVCACEEKRNC